MITGSDLQEGVVGRLLSKFTFTSQYQWVDGRLVIHRELGVGG